MLFCIPHGFPFDPILLNKRSISFQTPRLGRDARDIFSIANIIEFDELLGIEKDSIMTIYTIGTISAALSFDFSPDSDGVGELFKYLNC